MPPSSPSPFKSTLEEWKREGRTAGVLSIDREVVALWSVSGGILI